MRTAGTFWLSLLRLLWLYGLLFASGSGLAAGKAARVVVDVADQARRLLDEARTALVSRDLVTASQRAQASYRRQPSPEALFVLGQVALAEGRLLAAQDFMARYLADPDLEASSEDVSQREAQRVLDGERPPAASLNVLGDRGALVVVDGRLVGALPLPRPLLLSPAEHRIEIELGSRRLSDQVRLSVGRLAELRIDVNSRALLLSILPGVVVLDSYAGLDSAEQRRILLAIEAALLGLRLSPLSREVVFTVVGEPAPGECLVPARCARDLAVRCEADYVLSAQVTRERAGAKVALELYDASLAEPAGRSEQTCADCSLDALLKQLKEAVPGFYKATVARPRAQLDVVSEPSDAELRLDDRALGRTPFRGVVLAGRRELVLRQPDYEELRRSLPLREGDNPPLRYSLSLLPEPPPAPLLPTLEPQPSGRLPRPRWRVALGLGSVGIGALLLGFGASAAYFDRSCVTGQQPNCQQFLDTRAPAIGLLVSGGVLSLAGLALVLPPGPRRPSREEAPRGTRARGSGPP